MLVVGGGPVAGERPENCAGSAVVMNCFPIFSDKIALSSSGAQPVSREQSSGSKTLWKRLSAQARPPMPGLADS